MALVRVFGSQAAGSDNGISAANFKTAGRYTLASGASIDSLVINTAGGTPSALIKGVIYADASGAPGALIATTREVVGLSAGPTELPFVNSVVLAAGTYWLGFITDTNLTVTCETNLGVGGTNNVAYNTNSYAAGPSNPFGTPNGYVQYDNGMWAGQYISSSGSKVALTGGSRYEKTWQFDINRAFGSSLSAVLDTAKYLLWYYKAFLTGQVGGATKGLWTVVGSSDSVTGAMDGQDRWGSVFVPTKLVPSNNQTTPHSWVVLRSPTMAKHTYYLLIDYGYSSGGLQLNLYLGVDAPPTGGTASAMPTMVNGVQWTGNRYFSHSSNPGPVHVHGGLATDGSFYVLCSRDNTGLFTSGMVLSWLANAKPSDQYQVWLHLSCDQTAATGYGNGTSQDLSQTTYCVMRAPDNSQGGNWAGILPASTNFPAGVDMFDGSTLDWDIWVGATTAAYRSVRGRLQDIMYIAGGAMTGTIDNMAGAPTYMVVGNYWFPTNQAPIL